METPRLWRADLHAHTYRSKDSLTSAERFVAAARRAKLDRIAVTDHNTFQGALEASDLAPELIILGEEVMTTQGELLAYFLREEIPAGLHPRETISLIRDQNGIVSVAHPFDRFRSGSWSEADLLEILPWVDAVEGLNARCFFPGGNLRADRFAAQHHLGRTAGSDSHHPVEVGRAGLLIAPFDRADQFRDHLASARLFGSPSLPWVHLLSRFAALRKAAG
jgi:predicted metal-dependent phosphoesterase TrpH